MYEVKIIESSISDMSARDRLMLKDTSNARKFDEIVDSGADFTFRPVAYSVLEVHNDKADQPVYNQFIVVDSDGNKYVTGSSSFWEAFIDIWVEMDGEPFELAVYKKPSKNYKGKSFISCSIV